MNTAMFQPGPDVPAELEAAVRTSAANAPDLPHDLSGVRKRARTIRHRRIAAQAAVAVLVLAVAAVIPLLRKPSLTDISDWVGLPPIGLWLERDTLPVTAGLPPGNHVPGSIGEISAQLRIRDGKAIITPVGRQPGLDEGVHSGPAPLPGGGLATVGFLPPPDSQSHYQVLVVDADGRTVSSRPMPPTDTEQDRPLPMTGSATTLYWWAIRRTDRAFTPVLVSYDIAGGRLRELTPDIGQEIPYFGMQATAGRIVNWPASTGGPCSADILDAATGDLVTKLRPAVGECTDVYFALSPDNQRVGALVTYRDAKTWSQRVLSIDARTGRIQQDFPTPDLAAGTNRACLVTGIDWKDDSTLRYARGLLPAENATEPGQVTLTFPL